MPATVLIMHTQFRRSKRMHRDATVTILLLLLCAAAQGFILRRAGRCLCPRATMASIPMQYIKDIKFISRGPRCFKEQVIAVLTTGVKICIKPHSNWLKNIKREGIQRKLLTEDRRK
ncbi:interleukin-8-like [Scyliorhinus canicula]|uniref:interleukin-8-like n=1 Tax=Scyliorhinus canicula TaxID=7830 RepID=UPI0018F4AED7|nr:interleukin-8-like [Scyliorhinus canicula]